MVFSFHDHRYGREVGQGWWPSAAAAHVLANTHMALCHSSDHPLQHFAEFIVCLQKGSEYGWFCSECYGTDREISSDAISNGFGDGSRIEVINHNGWKHMNV